MTVNILSMISEFSNKNRLISVVLDITRYICLDQIDVIRSPESLTAYLGLSCLMTATQRTAEAKICR